MTKMTPGQEPYTTEELETLNRYVEEAAAGDPGELAESNEQATTLPPPSSKKKRTHLDRHVERERYFEQQITSLFIRARCSSATHEWLLEQRKMLMKHPHFSTLPQYMQQRLIFTFFHANVEALYAHNLIRWQHWLDDKRIESDAVPAGRWQDVRSRHEWTHSGEPFNEFTKEQFAK